MKYLFFLGFLVLLGCQENDSQFQIPGVSESIIVSKKNNLFIKEFSLSVIDGVDTIRVYSDVWAEKSWHIQKDSDHNIPSKIKLNENKYQIVLFLSDTVTSCRWSDCNFEVYDLYWKTCGMKGDKLYYSINKDAFHFDTLTLFVFEEDSLRKSLFFSEK